MKSPKLESVDNNCFSKLGKPSDGLRSLCFFFLFTHLNKHKKGKYSFVKNNFMFSYAVGLCLTQQVVGLYRSYVTPQGCCLTRRPHGQIRSHLVATISLCIVRYLIAVYCVISSDE